MSDIQNTLEGIYRMVTPTTLLGARRLVSSSDVNSVSIAKEVLDTIYGVNGVLSIDDLAKKLNELLQGTSGKQIPDELRKTFNDVIRLYASSDVTTNKEFAKMNNLSVRSDGSTENVTFEQIVGTKLEKRMGIILCTSPFLSPSCRNAERCEQFLNYVPSMIASRMSPVLDVEFVFNRIDSTDNLQSPGLVKFLVGFDNAPNVPGTGTHALISGREKSVKSVYSTNDSTEAYDTVVTSMGMEAFTAPQTLLNLDQKAQGSRYVDVIDPMRPLMSIESFNISVAPTAGLFSYKKGTLVIKLHDRSRLCDISDLIRPNVYQSAESAPTVWITYGWHYPEDSTTSVVGSSTYADFINKNMLVREAYGIANTQFSFDAFGQVTITLELWTKGMPTMRTLNVASDNFSSNATIMKLRAAAKRVAAAANVVYSGYSFGSSKDARGVMLLESAVNETFPALKQGEIDQAIKDLEAGYAAATRTKGKTPSVSQKNFKKLTDALRDYYSRPKGYNAQTFKEQVKDATISIVNERFRKAFNGDDPFRCSAKKQAKSPVTYQAPPTQFETMCDAIDAYLAEPESVTVKGTTEELAAKSAAQKRPGGMPDSISLTVGNFSRNETGFRRRVTTFGKLTAVFLGSILDSLDGIDELQLFFYQFNAQAGAAGGSNIAEFPIDTSMFFDQYREYVTAKGSGNITIEEFFRLVVDAQLGDMRGIGYGFRSFFMPYDPFNKDAKIKKVMNFNAEQAYENALSGMFSSRGPFSMPVIEFYIETTYVRADGTLCDSLEFYSSIDPTTGTFSDGTMYKRVMRLHVFDRVNDPYKSEKMLLRSEDDASGHYVEVNSSDVEKAKNSATGLNIDQLQKLIPQMQKDGTLSYGDANATTNQGIKDYVSKMVPSIIYGMNSSTVTNMTLASKQDALMTVAQMQTVAKKSGPPKVAQPNGSGVRGLPLRIIPATMTITSLGCPLLTFGQMFFVDLNTGTTVDNIYGLTGVTHTLTPGKFETQMTLTFSDAYGQYEGAPTLAEFVQSLKV
jgi:hypothetical protein